MCPPSYPLNDESQCNSENESESEYEEADDYEEDDWDDENRTILRSKWNLDGCSNLDEVVERTHELIEYYKKLKTDGWELEGPIDDDWGFLVRKT